MSAASNPATPVVWLDRTVDDDLMATVLVPDSVRAMRIETASGRTVDLSIADNVATGHLPDRPARTIATLADGSTSVFTYDLDVPAGDILPPTAAEIAKARAAGT